MPPPPKKERFNAKARQSSHKKRKVVKKRHSDDNGGGGGGGDDGLASPDVNAEIIDDEERQRIADAERQRRALLARSSDPSSADGPISSKKRKRLDAYIARQLKKEKRQQLIADLAKSSAQVGDRSAMMRASTLGTGRAQSGQDRLDQSEARQERHQHTKQARFGVVEDVYGDDSDDDEDKDLDLDDASSEGSALNDRVDEAAQVNVVDEEEDDERQARIAKARALFAAPATSTSSLSPSAALTSSTVGSALAVGADGMPVAPVVRRKAKKKQTRRATGTKTAWGRVATKAGDEEEQSSDFDSSAESAPEDVDEATDEESSEEEENDEEDDDEILEEAMRRRGLTSKIDDEDQSSDGSIDDEEDGGESSEEDGEEGDSEDESDGEPDISLHQSTSRRNGLSTTKKSEGFKAWAQSALGLAGDGDVREAIDDDDVYRGPEPVAGLSVKVKDLSDGTIRGPLGREEAPPAEQSEFAKRYYEELAGLDKATKKANNATVKRSEALQEARLKLPILADEDKITRTILENPVTILCGETGSGKTTQVPQFLYEAGFGIVGSSNPGLVGVTQPRRVAALSMAARVGQELGLGPDRVSHQIRYDATVSASTNVKFMTDGVLLRELANDFTLSKYSVIIIDEAHERSVNTDVLIGILSRVARLRAKKWFNGAERAKPLRLVIMSATLRVDDFAANARLFDRPPPVLQVDARQFPVVTHFNRRTSHDYVEEAIKKACKIHARLPSGGILIFLTGQAEIATVCKRLERRYGRSAIESRIKKRSETRKAYAPQARESLVDELPTERVTVSAREADVEVEDIDMTAVKAGEQGELALDVDDGVEEEDVDALDSDDDDENEDVAEYDADLPDELRDDSDTPMHVLPLYSLLPSDKQMLVFQPPPENTRLVVVATNIAETSLTIPGITYVVDCGRAKERKYDAENGIQSFEVGFVSKASADQRSGRAGRTGPGHCYRLYSSNVYEEHFARFAEPEILRMPVDNLVLMMKSMNIDNVANFPFPTPPDRQALVRAEKLLLRLGALSLAGQTDSASQYKITELGRSMSLFPLNTRLSKLLVQGHQHGCLPYVVALVAVLTVGDPFVKEESLHEGVDNDDRTELSVESQYLTSEKQMAIEQRKATRSSYFKALNRFAAMSGAISDPLRLLSVVGAYEHAKGAVGFCHENFLVPKLMEEVHKLRGQIASLVQANAAPTNDLSALRSTTIKPPTAKQMNVLRQFITSAFIDQIAIRADLAPESAARVPMLQQDGADGEQLASKQFYLQTKQGAKMQSTRNVAYLAAGIPGEACFVHKSSVLFHQQPPEWIVFSNVVRGRAKGDMLERKGRNWLKGVTIINPNWIYTLGPTLCSLSKPVDVRHSDARAKLVERAQELQRRARMASEAADDVDDERTQTAKQVYLVPTYGTGPAFDASERSSYVGWTLPAFMAKQRLSKSGKWITEV